MNKELEGFVEVVEDSLREHVHIRDERAYKVLAVWCAGTYYMDSWNEYPHIYIRSAMPESGKSVLARTMLCATANPHNAGSPSYPSLIETIKQADIKPTIFLDEAHQYFGPQAIQKWETFLLDTFSYDAKSQKMDRGSKGARWESHETNIFVPVMFASNPCPVSPAVLSRCLTVDMMRSPKRMGSRLDERRVKEYLSSFIDKLKATPGDSFRNYMEIGDTNLINRDELKWLPLIALADAIGGEWSKAIRNTALEWSQKDSPQDDEDNLMLVVLEGCLWAFHKTGKDRLSSKQLREFVNDHLAEEGFEPLKEIEFVKTLKRYGVRASKQLWVDEDGQKRNRKGFEREWFLELWKAYCPDLLEELLVVTPIKAIEDAVSQNGYDSSELHRLDALATARSFLTNQSL